MLLSDADDVSLQYVNVRLDAIVNDSSAAFLARAYLDPDTRLATILGTGLNAAVYLPVTALGPSKFGSRSPPPESDTCVLTNTELSMFGKNIFPTTRWDRALNATHTLPDYQPFEYLVAGKYIGEIVRLILLEATQTAGLFEGIMPPSLESATYSLDTKNLAFLDADESPKLIQSRYRFDEWYPCPHYPSEKDMRFIKQVVKRVSIRSAAYFTVGMHALTAVLQTLGPIETDQITIGCDGSIINNYPSYFERAQQILNQMIESGDPQGKKISLEKTRDSPVVGAAVAAAMAAPPVQSYLVAPDGRKSHQCRKPSVKWELIEVSSIISLCIDVCRIALLPERTTHLRCLTVSIQHRS